MRRPGSTCCCSESRPARIRPRDCCRSAALPAGRPTWASPTTRGAYLGAADAFVQPAGYDPRPTAVLDAMAAGLPPIVTERSGAAALVREHDCGMVVPPRDGEALAAAIGRLMEPALRERMATAARAAVLPFNFGGDDAEARAALSRPAGRDGARPRPGRGTSGPGRASVFRRGARSGSGAGRVAPAAARSGIGFTGAPAGGMYSGIQDLSRARTSASSAARSRSHQATICPTASRFGLARLRDAQLRVRRRQRRLLGRRAAPRRASRPAAGR